MTKTTRYIRLRSIVAQADMNMQTGNTESARVGDYDRTVTKTSLSEFAWMCAENYIACRPDGDREYPYQVMLRARQAIMTHARPNLTPDRLGDLWRAINVPRTGFVFPFHTLYRNDLIEAGISPVRLNWFIENGLLCPFGIDNCWIFPTTLAMTLIKEAGP